MKTNLSIISIVASIGGLLFGFDTAVISGTIDFVKDYYHLSEFMSGWFTSSALVGCIVGAMFAGKFADKYGRKPSLIIAGVLFLISAIFSGLPINFEILIVARLIGGLGVGMASVVAPLYISEFAPAHLRGRLVALYQLSIVIGVLLAYSSNWYLLSLKDANLSSSFFNWVIVEDVWRGMFIMETIPAIMFIALLFIVPETPRYLYSKGKSVLALNILSQLNGEMVANQIVKNIENSFSSVKIKLSEILKSKYKKALIIGLSLSIFGQLSGVNIVIYYGPKILQEAGMSIGSALQYQVAIGLINLIFTLVAMSVIDKFGRRFLLVGGMFIVSVSLLLTSILFMIPNTPAIAIVIILCVYIAFVALSICAVIWVITPEIFPNKIRAKAMSICTLANWTTNAVAIFFFPWYVNKLGMGVGFLTFAVICFVGSFIFYKYVPETKNKSLEEIEELF
jgi:SP family arabinose:H+ symporter-like MFS transporter